MCDTPGSKALENLNKLEEAMIEFKKPTNQALKRKKPKILTEEKYIEELSKIIQRDFFPDLDKLNAQNNYLDAMERKDYVEMAAIRAKYSGTQHSERSRSMTPATFETPATSTNGTPRQAASHSAQVPDGSDTPRTNITSVTCSSDATGKSLSVKHSLDSFLQAYTSEDNCSFQEIIDAADERLRQKFAVLYNEEQLSAEKLEHALTLPTIEQQFEEPDPLRKIETWNYKNKNSVMYIPDGVALTETERIENVNRRQIIKHSSTRLSSNPFPEKRRPPQTMQEAVRAQLQLQRSNSAGIGGNKIAVAVDDKNLSSTNNAAAAVAMPQIRGFDLVKTPSPRPGEAFSPLMTWGEIEGTPFRLDGSDTPLRPNTGPSFKINESSRRETIGLALAEKVGEKMRAQKQRAMDTARKNIGSPFIRSNMERLASMSPAARRLATAKLGVRTPIMSSLTPPICSPQKKAKVVTTATSRKTNLSSSSSSAVNTPKQISSGKSTLTDDLLKIPTKRLKASDFF